MDHLDILDGLAELSDSEDDAAWATNERRGVEEVAAAGRLQILKRAQRMSDVAASVGWASEYRAVYRLYSKYVHPTPWRMCSGGDANRFLDDLVRMTLIGRSTAYARELLTFIAEDADRPTNDAAVGVYDRPLAPAQPDMFAAPLHDKELARLLEQLDADDPPAT